ncbi:hypothetical protein DPMN_181572 [Dreissena polymorpha]|uniref:Uncharacterized protein n=1 Tax=Dreissena polymorpha TaxID=45954 RepID=A0A9D4DDZ4_DREPO|nr:hypothetical protein DPMN_181572 [Dreissena polymorpha]
MSLALIDKLHLQARKTSEEDVGKICSSLTALFGVPEKSSEATALMRQLFFILQAKETSTRLPSGLIFNLINAVMVRDRGRIKECLLCERILQEVFPLDKKFDPELAKLNEKIPSPIHLWMCQDIESLSKLFAKAVRWLKAQDLEWEAERKLFTFLVGVALIHPDLLSADRVRSVHERVGSWLLGAGLYQAPNPYSSNPFRKDQNNPVTEVDGTPSNNIFTVLSIGQYYTDDQLVNIFSFSMLYQWISNSYHGLLINNSYPMEPGDDASDLEKDDELDLYRSQPQRIRSSSRSSHVSKNSDDTASPTSVASVEKTPVTKTWSADLSKSSRPRTPVRKAQSLVTEGDGDRFSLSVTSTASERLTTEFKNSSPSDTVWLTESGETSERPVSTQTTLSLSEVPRSPNPKAAMDTEEVKRELTKHVFEPLIGRTIDYCFRLLDQCDRKPKNQSDVELLNACQLETVKLLEFVCRIDGAQIPRVFRELKRLMANCTQDDRNPKLLIAILQFLVNHSKAVAYDCQQELNKLFHGVLSRNFDQTAVSFDIVMFVLDNLEKLTHQYHVMAIYFPNIFKILAWNPHTFISDFQDILPAMMSSVTSLEVFHTLVDLPCMTVALEVIERTKHLDFTSLQPVTDEQPTRALDAFKNAMFRPMFNFFTRSEGGHGDTIDRLDQFHTSIQDMVDLPRVLVCYQSAALLLRTWFSVILEEVDQDFVSRLLPVLTGAYRSCVRHTGIQERYAENHSREHSASAQEVSSDCRPTAR